MFLFPDRNRLHDTPSGIKLDASDRLIRPHADIILFAFSKPCKCLAHDRVLCHSKALRVWFYHTPFPPLAKEYTFSVWEVLVTEIIRRYGIIDKIVLENVNLQRYCEEPNMKCHACGRELNKAVTHCMYCGTPVPSGKEQASLTPQVTLKEQGLLQPDSRRPFPRWIPAALSGVLLLCLTLYWIIPRASSITGSIK